MSDKTVSDLKYVLCFFENPTLPCFLPKGPDKNIILKVPKKFVDVKYVSIYDTVMKRPLSISKKEWIYVKILEELPTGYDPDISYLQKIDPLEGFSTFNPFHTTIAGYVIGLLLKVDIKYFLSLCAKIQIKGVNPDLFNYCLSVAMTHRDELCHMPIPSRATTFPDFYFSTQVIHKALSLSNLPRVQPTYVLIEPSATDVDVENRVAYFREDIGMNLHHWHWHIIYPVTSDEDVKKKMDKDRRGEIFIYMHEQMMARFNAERFCNKLNRVVGLHDLSEPLNLAHFPKLTALYSKFRWAARPKNLFLQDLNRDGMNYKKTDMSLWRDRILDACHTGYYLPAPTDTSNDNPKDTDKSGLYRKLNMDILGKMMEPNEFSPNRGYYGELHNAGHDLIAFAHDPDKRYLEGFGVMGNNSVAARDPIFYRWHTFFDDVCEEYRKTLKPYTNAELTFNGIAIEKLEVITKSSNNEKIKIPEDKRTNTLYTFNETDKINLSQILDPNDEVPIYVLFQHLQRQEFTYKLLIRNTTAQQKSGTVRIFMAPTESEDGKLMTLAQQRRFFIELDRFKCELGPNQVTEVTRSCEDSVVTIPLKDLIINVDEIRAQERLPTKGAYCGCGWPAYMLIPKGTPNGINFTLFAMVSNYEDDKVEDDNSQSCGGSQENKNASSTTGSKTEQQTAAFSYCGLKNKKYPDRKPMGYPFDRPIHDTYFNFEKILNMKTQEVEIIHLEDAEDVNGVTMAQVNIKDLHYY